MTSIIQVGDYWMYEHLSRQVTRRRDPVEEMQAQLAMLKEGVAERTIIKVATEHGVDPDRVHLFFCDGNHEDFSEERGLYPDAPFPIRLSNHVTYMPRGTVLELHGYRVGFLGGGASVDREWRTSGVDWWPQERMSEEQIDRAKQMGQLDLLVTHETTPAVFDALTSADARAEGKAGYGEEERNAIASVLAATTPRWHVHGHHHEFGVYDQGQTRTVSLSSDARPGAVALLKEDGTVTPLPGQFGESIGRLNCSPIPLDT